jgi:hypothetical protein
MAFNDASLSAGTLTGQGYPASGWFSDPNWVGVRGSSGTTFAPPSSTVVSTSTGVSPVESQYSLYGHTVPLSVFGVGRIGGEIISGPWVTDGLASFIISFGVPADPSGARILREIAFDSEVVWTGSLTGSGTPSSAGFSTEPITCRFYDGTLTQSADALESTHFGADAVAYRPQILIAFENVPLANTKFGKIPYVAAVIADTQGDDVNLGEAFERLAYSPWVGFTSSEFETVGITDGLVSGGLIIAEQSEFLATIQSFGRFYPKWSILQTDKLRIVDRGDTVTPDIILDSSKLTGDVVLSRQEPNSVPSILELLTIDPDADYTIVPSRAQSPRDPVAVTTSVKSDSAYLPVIMDSATRISLVTYAKHHEDRARKQISLTAMFAGIQTEPGDLLGILELSADFPGGETFRVLETLHGQNGEVEIVAESLLQCTVTSLTTTPTPPPPVGGPFASFDPSSVASVSLSGSNLVATNTGTTSTNQGAMVASSSGKTTGKYYFEYTLTTFAGGSGVAVGLGTTASAYSGMSTLSTHGNMVFVGSGQIWSDTNNSIFTLGRALISGDRVCVAADLTNSRVWIRLNSGLWQGAPGNDPTIADGTHGGAATPAGTLVPFVTFGNGLSGGSGVANNVITANFGGSPFVGVVPTGYTGWPQ